MRFVPGSSAAAKWRSLMFTKHVVATTLIAASFRIAILSKVRLEGRWLASQSGIGFDPLTLSKTILSGHGVIRKNVSEKNVSAHLSATRRR